MTMLQSKDTEQILPVILNSTSNLLSFPVIILVSSFNGFLKYTSVS